MGAVNTQPRTFKIVGDVAQLGERRLCKAEVVGSIPIISTNLNAASRPGFLKRVSYEFLSFLSAALSCREWKRAVPKGAVSLFFDNLV